MKYPKPSPSFSERELPLPPNRGTLCWFSPGGPRRAHPIQESGTIVNFFPPTRTDEPQKPQSLGRSHVQVPPIQAQRCPGHMAPPPPRRGKLGPASTSHQTEPTVRQWLGGLCWHICMWGWQHTPSHSLTLATAHTCTHRRHSWSNSKSVRSKPECETQQVTVTVTSRVILSHDQILDQRLSWNPFKL